MTSSSRCGEGISAPAAFRRPMAIERHPGIADTPHGAEKPMNTRHGEPLATSEDSMWGRMLDENTARTDVHFVAFELETTGLDAVAFRVVEFGAVRFTLSGGEVSQSNS